MTLTHLLAVHLRVHGAEEVRHVPRITVYWAAEAAGPGLGPQLPRGGLNLVQVVVTVPGYKSRGTEVLTLSWALPLSSPADVVSQVPVEAVFHHNQLLLSIET